jgi:uncharacterized protein (DUF169 family)
MESKSILEKLNQEIMTSLRPKTLPFGVKLYETLNDRPSNAMRPRHPMNTCQITALTRYYGRTMYATLEDLACVIGAVTLGMMEPPENMRSGKIAEMLHADLESARRFTELVPRIPCGRVKAFASAPLSNLSFYPDLIVMYGNTAQVMRVVQAYLYKRGGRVGFTTGGEYSLCADTIADTYNKQDLSVAIPCFGDRKTGLAQDDELTVAFPVSLADEILDGLQGTTKTAAYPTPMDIGFPQMPDYTLTDWSVAFRKSMTRRNP